MTNFLPTTNPFGLARPPASFLRALAAYDPQLVIFASESEGLYRMGRRGRYGHGLLSVLKHNPDTAVFVAHRAWPWKSILPRAVGMDWNRVLLEIPSYDTQRFGDAGERLDAIEAAAEDADARRMANDLDALGSQGYKLMKLMTGQRVGYGARPEGAGYKKLPAPQSRTTRQSSYRPLGAGAGAMFVGR